MKGITPVVAIILLLLVTISMVGFAFMFFTRTAQTAAKSGEEQLQQQIQQFGVLFRVESLDVNRVHIRNLGTTPLQLSSIAFYVNDQKINASGPLTLATNSVGEYLLNDSELMAFQGTVTLRISGGTFEEKQSICISCIKLNNLITSSVAYWKLDESGGTRSDSVGSSHLTDQNTVTSNPGKRNDAAQFTAANSEYLSLADNDAASMGDIDFTIAAWTYLDTAGGNLRTLIQKGDGGDEEQWGTRVEYRIMYNGGGEFAFTVGDGSGVQGHATTVNSNIGGVSTGTWYFIVAWHNTTANTINIQVNNGAVSSAAHPYGSHNGAYALAIGRNSAPTPRFWDGRIDEVGIWKRVLSAQERADLYSV